MAEAPSKEGGYYFFLRSGYKYVRRVITNIIDFFFVVSGWIEVRSDRSLGGVVLRRDSVCDASATMTSRPLQA